MSCRATWLTRCQDSTKLLPLPELCTICNSVHFLVLLKPYALITKRRNCKKNGLKPGFIHFKTEGSILFLPFILTFLRKLVNGITHFYLILFVFFSEWWGTWIWITTKQWSWFYFPFFFFLFHMEIVFLFRFSYIKYILQSLNYTQSIHSEVLRKP